jgi:hypothetical protein
MEITKMMNRERNKKASTERGEREKERWHTVKISFNVLNTC